MTTAVLEVTANPQLRLTPTTVMYSGTVRLGNTGAVAYSGPGKPPDEYGFFLPDAPPWDGAGEPPAAWAEAHLMVLRMIDTRFEMGVQEISTGYRADPRGGATRWLHCTVLAHAPFPLRLGYRVYVTA